MNEAAEQCFSVLRGIAVQRAQTTVAEAIGRQCACLVQAQNIDVAQRLNCIDLLNYSSAARHQNSTQPVGNYDHKEQAIRHLAGQNR
jgi:hypothetical protein